MLASAADIETGSALEADLVIVGAGAAGITIATRLIGRPLNVVVLESGGVDFEQEVQDLYRGTVIGLPTEDPDVSRLRYFGGTTNHWAGWCRPLEPEDFEPRAAEARGGGRCHLPAGTGPARRSGTRGSRRRPARPG